MWGWVTWVVIALAMWVVVAVLVGLVIGRVIRRRDQQRPVEAAESFPTPRTPPERSVPEHRPRT